MTKAPDAARYRWLVLAVFVLSSAINYLDRQTLGALEPVLRGEFHLSNTEYGWIQSAFLIAYGVSAPFAGMLVDRIGLDHAISLAVGVWSCAGIATGFTSSLGGLVACRAVLGIAEAAGVPSTGKAIHQYLRPAERAMGNAVSQAGLSLGSIVAPPLAVWLALRSGWRRAFIVTGVLGLTWIPVWNRVSRRAAVAPPAKLKLGAGVEILRDRRLWTFAAANAIGMLGYAVWTIWTTPYLVHERHLTLAQSAGYAAILPLFPLAGGLTGGWLSMRQIERGMAAPMARFRVCLMAAALSLLTAAIPAAHSVNAAFAGMAISFFAVAVFSVNMYTLPLDVFEGPRAAFAVSMLVASYGAAQAVMAPLLGWVIDHHGYTPVTSLVAVAPLAACVVLWRAKAIW